MSSEPLSRGRMVLPLERGSRLDGLRTLLACALVACLPACGDIEGARNASLRESSAATVREFMSVKTDSEWWHLAPYACRGLADLGRFDEARGLAQEMLNAEVGELRKVNVGTVHHFAHIVLGRIAVAAGDLEEAQRQLGLAGGVPSSPHLRSYGPDMRLADELLRAGRKDAVLRYLEQCEVLWGQMGLALSAWTDEVRAGRIPNWHQNF